MSNRERERERERVNWKRQKKSSEKAVKSVGTYKNN